MYFFTADEHYGHMNIIRYCDRPFSSIAEMDREIIRRHNSVVSDSDTVIHAGDFTLGSREVARTYQKQLRGKHIFLRGSHDRWMKGLKASTIWERTIDGWYIVVCHYAMRVWSRSHYNSWQLYGHSHGALTPIGKQWDIGVDNNDYYPLSFDDVKRIMMGRPDNLGLVK